jgi:hypothetical protein
MLMHEGIHLLLFEAAITIYNLAARCLRCHAEKQGYVQDGALRTRHGDSCYTCAASLTFAFPTTMLETSPTAYLNTEQEEQHQIGC